MTDWIDRKSLLANTGGDRELAAEVLGIFESQVQTWGQMLNSNSEPEHWADAAHTIKGAALGIGAHQLAEVCKTVEQRGRSEAPPSRTETSLLINDIRDVLLPTQDAAARLRHEFGQWSEFRSSNLSNS